MHASNPGFRALTAVLDHRRGGREGAPRNSRAWDAPHVPPHLTHVAALVVWGNFSLRAFYCLLLQCLKDCRGDGGTVEARGVPAVLGCTQGVGGAERQWGGDLIATARLGFAPQRTGDACSSNQGSGGRVEEGKGGGGSAVVGWWEWWLPLVIVLPCVP